MRTFLLAATLLLFSATAFGQASVYGQVVESDGHPLTQASVQLQKSDGSAAASTLVDAQGNFNFNPLEPGDYRLVVKAAGHYDGEYTIVVRPRQVLQLTAELPRIGTNKQQVEVQSTYSDLGTGQTGATRFLSRESLQGLPAPLERDVPTLALDIFPGASLSHDNFVHVRGNEVSLHEFINGVGFLDNPQEQFGPGLSPLQFENVDMISGWFPAEFGNRFGGVLDVTTRSGYDQKGHGALSLGMGSFATDDFSGEYGGTRGKFSYYFFSNGFKSGWFLNPPERDPLHDFGHGLRNAAQFDYRGSRDSWKLLVLASGTNFELPNSDDDQAVGRDAARRLRSQTSILTWQHVFSAHSLVTSSVYERTVADRLLPTTDSVTEFGVGSRSDLTFGFKSDFTYTEKSHTFKAGIDLTRLRLLESFSYDSRMPPPLPNDILPAFSYQGGVKGGEVSLYGQDHFSPARNLFVDLGIRYDHFGLISTFVQVSPRVGIAYHFPNTGSVLHFAYNRFFSPHPIEFAALASFLGTTAPDPDQRVGPVKAFVQDYLETGWEQRLHPKVFLEFNAFRHTGRTPFEYREIGETRLFLPINSARSNSKGADVQLVLKQLDRLGVSAQIQYAYQRTYFFGPISGGFANGEDKAPGERFLPAFDETHTGTAGLTYRAPWHGAWSSVGMRYGSGTPLESGLRLPGHFTANLAAGFSVWSGEDRGLDFEFDATNVADNRFQVAKESEETPVQFAPARIISGHLKFRF